MHPRNKYKTPPNFTDLACLYREFLSVSTLDLNGCVKLNFKDPKALKVLTKCLLHHDFNLDVEIPDDRLVPTVPLRLNYLLWIEDLLDAAGMKNDVTGIDIGTGSCCIYPLLAAVQYRWKMIGTESDDKNSQTALTNVSNNNLENLITVKKVPKDSSIILHCFEESEEIKLESAHFCMCNPPFYSSVDEMNLGRTPSRAPPKNAHTGMVDELITPGGEVAFVTKMIEESILLKDKIKIYTTMLGHKSSMKPLLQHLKAKNVKYFSQTVFHQGRTMRWGLAWSFIESTNLLTDSQPTKHGKPMSFLIPPLENIQYDVENVTAKVLDILKTIEIKYKVLQKKDVIRTMEIKAEKNTWSNQRRKRRQEKLNISTTQIANKVADDISERNVDNDDEPHPKKAKIIAEEEKKSDEVCVASPQALNKIKDDIKEQASSLSPFTSTSRVEDFVTAAVCIRKNGESIMFEIGYVSGSGGKDSVHQIVQYIKNNWK